MSRPLFVKTGSQQKAVTDAFVKKDGEYKRIKLLYSKVNGEWKHKHEYGEWVTTDNPSCTTDGSQTSTCPCEACQTRTTPALGHDFNNKKLWDTGRQSRTEATCTEDATYWVECLRCTVNTNNDGSSSTNAYFTASECEQSFDSTPTKALGHNIVIDYGYDATCTTKGLTNGSHCTRCTDMTIAQTSIPALGHNWGDWITTVDATCTTDGEQTRTCINNLAHTETKPITAPGHTVSDGPHVSYIDTHHWSYYYCAKCDTYQDVPGTYEEHNRDGWEMDTPPTCTEDALGHSYCTICGKYGNGGVGDHTGQPGTSALGHAWKDATCEDPKTCKTCGATEGSINPNNHTGNTNTVAAVAATCTVPGKQAYTYCTDCSQTLSGGNEIPALGHSPATTVTWGTNCSSASVACTRSGCTTSWSGTPSKVATQAADCITKNKYKHTVTINVNGTNKTFECTGHTGSVDSTVHNTQCTFVKDALSGQCGHYSKCGAIVTGHSYPGSDKYYYIPLANGTQHQAAVNCTSCGYVKTGAIKNCTYTVTKAATCTASGTKTCDKCGRTVTIEALGHTWVNGKCTTCTTTCSHRYIGTGCTKTCKICGKTKTTHVDLAGDGICDKCGAVVVIEKY